MHSKNTDTNTETTAPKITTNEVSRYLKDLNHLIKEMKPQRHENNFFVKHPLQKNLEVPKWVVDEREAVFYKINTIRYEYKLPDLTAEEYQKLEQSLSSFNKSKFYEKLFATLLDNIQKQLTKRTSAGGSHV